MATTSSTSTTPTTHDEEGMGDGDEAPLPHPTTSTNSYHLPLAAPTASLIASDGADDLGSDGASQDRFRPPAPLPPTSRSSPPTSSSHQIQTRGHSTRTSRPPSRPTPTLPTLVEHSNRAAPLTRKLNHLAQLACESIRGARTRFPDVRPTTDGADMVGSGVVVVGMVLKSWYYFFRRRRAPRHDPASPALTRGFLTLIRFDQSGSTARTAGLWASPLEDTELRRSQIWLVQCLGLGVEFNWAIDCWCDSHRAFKWRFSLWILLGLQRALEDEIRVVNPRPEPVHSSNLAVFNTETPPIQLQCVALKHSLKAQAGTMLELEQIRVSNEEL
ncbi:hypothetical protein C8R46DRAFT_1225788 [Mycena filopes]|nr:hypothetical protein C8R46DRAFT_1225788 [Mycena filopes]